MKYSEWFDQCLELAKWQWDGYAQYHSHKDNLLLHIVLVPLFLFAHLAFIFALLNLHIISALLALALMAVSIKLQGHGHAQEPVAPLPFTSKGNAIARILMEQWVTFPRFVYTGRWWQALQAAL